MGTRNLTIVVSGGKHCVAQYGQWDGYPDGQGSTVLKFADEWLVDSSRRARFRDQLQYCRFLTDEGVKALYDAEGIGQYMNMKQAQSFKQKYPSIDRDMAAEVLEYVRFSDTPVLLKDSYDFAKDSLFCEWAYVIDLDKNTFEVYRGFNKDPLPKNERFAPLGNDGEYYPIKLAKSWSLDNLPTEEEFLKGWTEEDE